MSAARTERLLNLLTLLLNTRRPLSLREIREMDEFAAYRSADPKSGERAFERDKSALIELGIPLQWVQPDLDMDGDGDATGGYIIDRDRYYLPELDLDASELALLSIAGAAAVAIEHFPGRAAIIRALAKLGFDVDEEQRTATLAHAPLQAGIDAERVAQNLEVLHDAVGMRRRVSLSYEGVAGAPTRREVDPFGLYYRQGAWYLVGYCHLREGERTFHLGRMALVELAPEPAPDKGKKARERTGQPGVDFEPPPDFDLSAHARRRPWEFPSEAPVDVVIRLADRLVPAIPEIFGGAARTEVRDGETLVHITVTHRDALVSAVLPHGADAEVLEPPELRSHVRAIYETLALRYGDTA